MRELNLSDTIKEETADQLRTQIWSLVPDWQADELGEFQFLSGGYSNANFSFSRIVSGLQQRYVLRVPQRPQPFVDRVAEARWYEQLPSSIGVQPEVLDIQTGLMISPWIEGALLIDVFKQDASADDLLDYLARLHRALPQTSRQYHVPTLLPLFVEEEAFPSGIHHSVPADESASPARGPQPNDLISCHNDLNPWNILVTESGWITLDWEFAGTNDPLFDLVSLHQGLELNDALLPEMATTLICGIDLPRLNTAYEHFWLREWAWATFQRRSGNARSEVLAQIAVAESKLESLKSF